MEIRVTATDPNSGATATAVKGFKYRGDDTNSTTSGSPSNTDCDVTGTMAEVNEESGLMTNGSKKMLYSYLEID